MITVDFETYYDDDYSLSKMTMEEYLRDPRFQVTYVAVIVDDEPALGFSGDFADTHLWLQQFDWTTAMNGHNNIFDASILAWKFGIRPPYLADTMSMVMGVEGVEHGTSLAACAQRYNLPAKGTAVHNAKGLRREQMTPQFLVEYGDYCKHDAWLCRQLYKILKPLVPVEELLAIDWTLKCFVYPSLRVDTAKAAEALQATLDHRRTLLTRLGVSQESLRSDQIFSELLINAGIEPPTKTSPTTGETVWAFAKSDTAFMDLLDNDDEDVVALVEARLANKTSQVETRSRSLLEIGQRGAMPYPLAYASAQPTLRWQAYRQQKVNLQNLPRAKKGQRSPLRDAIVAPEGYKMLVIDLSQIELRVNAWLWNERSILDILENGGDVYSSMASQIFNYAVDKANFPMERFVGKTAELGCGYQCGGDKFALMLRVAARRYGFRLADESNGFGKIAVDAYRQSRPNIVSGWKQCDDALRGPMMYGQDGQLGRLMIERGRIKLPDGLPMYYPQLRVATDEQGRFGPPLVYSKRVMRSMQKRYIYGGKLDENLCQRIARGVMRDGIIRLSQRYWVAGSVHDEAIALIPNTESESAAMDYAIESMTTRPWYAPDLPLAAEGGIGRCYGDAK